MRVKAVIISKMEGATDSRVKIARICSEVETSCGLRAVPTSTLTRGRGNRLLRNSWQEQGESEEEKR